MLFIKTKTQCKQPNNADTRWSMDMYADGLTIEKADEREQRWESDGHDNNPGGCNLKQAQRFIAECIVATQVAVRQN